MPKVRNYVSLKEKKIIIATVSQSFYMKYLLTIFFAILFPFFVLAQDTSIVKEQANELAQAAIRGNFKKAIDFTYPKLVELAGGKAKMLKVAKEGMASMKKKGVKPDYASIGAPGKFYKAGKQIHCLVPETIRLKLSRGHAISNSFLLAISNDGGKNWKFIDLNQFTNESILDILPNFNQNLKIPKTGKPLLYRD